jgi:hypothetical protein
MTTAAMAEPEAAGEPGLRRGERLLPYACLAGAFVMGAAELMKTFQLVEAGGDPLKNLYAYDRHHYALLVLAAFGVVATITAVLNGSKPAAAAASVAGVMGLVIFLIVDLPDANSVGAFNDPTQSLFNAKAVPQAGFWLELVGSLSLALAGAALATLTPTQLVSLRPKWLVGSAKPTETDEAVQPFDHDADDLERRRREREMRRSGRA